MIFWKILSFLGSEEFYLIVMPALLWCVNARLGLRVGILFLLSANLNGALKLFFHAPRPAWIDAKIIAHAFEASFGFPSGHAQNAVAVWGLLAAKAKKPLAWGIALALCVFIGLSRLALNVHFVGDVLGGWLIGALLLGAFLMLERPLGAWLKEANFDFLSLFIFCCAASWVLLLCESLLGKNVSSPSVLASAYEASQQSNFKTAGALFGLLIGAYWMLKNGGYVHGGNKIARYLIGLCGVLVFWFGLGKILPRGEDIISLCAAYMRYALVGFWISAGAPTVFRKMERRIES